MNIKEAQLFSHFPKDRNCEVLANQNDKGSLQKTHWRSSTSSRKIWRLDKRLITKSSTRRVNHGTITDMLSLFKILPLNGFILTCAKHKLLRKTEKSSRKFLEPSEKPKVIYTDDSLKIGKSFEDARMAKEAAKHSAATARCSHVENSAPS